jgi:hypothetical protein
MASVSGATKPPIRQTATMTGRNMSGTLRIRKHDDLIGITGEIWRNLFGESPFRGSGKLVN